MNLWFQELQIKKVGRAMRTITRNQQSLMDNLTELILKKITGDKTLDKLDYLRCKLGIETFLCNLSKLIVIYAVALLIGLAIPVLIFHLAYMSIRVYAYGAHSNSSTHCTILSCFILVGMPFALGFVQTPRIAFIALYFVNYLILKRYAPASTMKNGLTHSSMKRKEELKTKVLMINNITFIIALMMPNILIGNLIMFGTWMASLMTTPFVYKILKNERRD